MAGFTVQGQKYWLNGFYGTAQEHAARQTQARQAKEASDEQARAQSGYAAGAGSADAAGAAATKITNMNPNVDYSIGPNGQTSLSNQSAQARAAAEAAAQQREAEENRRRAQQIADRNALLAIIEKQNQGSAATITHPGAGGNEDARTAAFSRAKDQAGKIARASLTAIAEEMAGRGISGSGIEFLREAGALDQTAGGLVEVTRDQAIADAQRAAQVNDQIYQGGITQRGQDLANRQSYLALLKSLYSY